MAKNRIRQDVDEMSLSEEEIRTKIDACPDRWIADHWLNCDACRPLRRLLRIRLAGFATFEDFEIDQAKYFKICDNCNETYLASEDSCVKCHNDRLRKEIRPDRPEIDRSNRRNPAARSPCSDW